jgi:hypothetical protein
MVCIMRKTITVEKWNNSGARVRSVCFNGILKFSVLGYKTNKITIWVQNSIQGVTGSD